MAEFGLDIIRNEEDSDVCFGVNLREAADNEELPVGVIVRHLNYEAFSDYLIPLKKMKFMDVDVMVPNNPIAFLEKIYEDGNDALKEVNLFEETKSAHSQWEHVRGEGKGDG